MPKIVDHEEQRVALSATVATVVAREGLEHATLRVVAARHGCTKGMVQHYFSGKDELLLAGLKYTEEQCAHRLEALDKQDPQGLEGCLVKLQALLPMDEATLDEWRVRLAFGTLAGHSPPVRQMLAEYQNRHQSALLRLLRQAQRNRELKDSLSPNSCYRQLISLVYGMGVEAVMNATVPRPGSQKAMLKEAVNNLRQ